MNDKVSRVNLASSALPVTAGVQAMADNVNRGFDTSGAAESTWWGLPLSSMERLRSLAFVIRFQKIRNSLFP